MSEWLPIETAPKNPEGEPIGPWILVCTADRKIWVAHWGFNNERRGGWRRQAGFEINKVTYWMTLPEPPAE